MKCRHLFAAKWLPGLVTVLITVRAFPAPPAAGGQSSYPEVITSTKPPLVVANAGYRLLIDAERGTIVSFRSTFGVDRELLVPDHDQLPLFKIEFMNDRNEFKTVTSAQAKEVKVSKSGNSDGTTIIMEFREIGQLPVDARVIIRCPASETLTYWNLEVNNGTTSWIGHIQFPVVEVPFDDPANKQSSHILWSFGDGALSGPVGPLMAVGAWDWKLDGPWYGRTYDTPEVWRYNNYPGEWTTTQLMAYYDEVGGLYVALDDPKGLPKFIDPLIERDGVTMGLGHYPGTRGPGVTKLPYNVVLGTFHGDWYAAAEIYRNWASQQPFCSTKLADRTDIPKWIVNSGPAIAFPMRGQADWDSPVTENPEYTPVTNALPYLDKLAAALDGPLMPIVFNWEHPGPWIQPDAFPPLGGDATFREFMAKTKARGWHPMIYGDGLCWVTWQKNSNYDGMPYFRAHDGESAVVRKWDGTLLEDVWPWRRNYFACVGTEKGRQMVVEMTRRMAEFGPDAVQQFDQGPGPFACYAANHGHPPVPGPWMTEGFTDLVRAHAAAARSVNPQVVLSSEGAPPETYLQNFQTWDGRTSTCPLYSFLYHEYANAIGGFFTHRVNDESLRLSAARALVTGYIVNYTLRDKGQIEYDWDQPWTRAVPDQAGIIDWTRRITKFRAGVARDYLVYGRMLRPWKVSGVTERDYGWFGKELLVQSATWRAQDGRTAVVLANYSNLAESPRVELEGQGTRRLTMDLDGRKTEREVELPSAIDVQMEPRSLCLIELK